jgi:hypothetical protein
MLVGTPSMGVGPDETSSTKTPGCECSGTISFLSCRCLDTLPSLTGDPWMIRLSRWLEVATIRLRSSYMESKRTVGIRRLKNEASRIVEEVREGRRE